MFGDKWHSGLTTTSVSLIAKQRFRRTCLFQIIWKLLTDISRCFAFSFVCFLEVHLMHWMKLNYWTPSWKCYSKHSSYISIQGFHFEHNNQILGPPLTNSPYGTTSYMTHMRLNLDMNKWDIRVRVILFPIWLPTEQVINILRGLNFCFG